MAASGESPVPSVFFDLKKTNLLKFRERQEEKRRSLQLGTPFGELSRRQP